MNDNTWKPRFTVFVCNWSMYAPQDRAEIQRCIQGECGENTRVINILCAGRINPLFVMTALQRGADGVIVIGCHSDECHYKQGNYLGRRRLAELQRLLDFVGIEKERVRFVWAGAADRGVYQREITRAAQEITALGPAQVMVMSQALPA